MSKISGKVKKIRLDELLVTRGYAKDLPLARALVMAGQVLVNEQKAKSSAVLLSTQVDIRLIGVKTFVSRGGEKLKSAIEKLKLEGEFEGAVVLDVGASTGGFTDCCLQHGARKVYAVDVGSNQLAWKLRQDERVVVMEKTDIRDFQQPQDETINWVVADVSFNSLDNLLPSILSVASEPKTQYLLLVKPQFELEAELIPKGGVVSDAKLHELACQRVERKLQESGLKILSTIASGVLGRFGNQEFFVLACQK